MVVSVIICTYNRSFLLQNLLQSFVECNTDIQDYEIIVVDNGSSDDTPFIVEKYKDNFKYFQYVYEKKQGLSYARNAGVYVARSDYVAFVDDDCLIAEGWLDRAVEIINRVSPDVFGGDILPFYIGEKPVWYQDKYALLSVSDKESPLPEGQYVMGGNMFFRKSVILTLGGFDPNLGMSGGNINYGEETALQIKLRQKYNEGVIYYDPKLVVKHLVRSEKMTFSWLIRSSFSKGRDNIRIKISSDKAEKINNLFMLFFNFAKSVVAIIFHIIYATLFRNKMRYPFFMNYFYEKTLCHFWKIGNVWQLMQSS
ncbi:MAG: glycosyltransferase family 2 protein [Desulfuromonadales bacterium]|nr:glycosyltransferase family 2 protein [Desulfuromonadales bacterium]